jgi:acyl-CoA synthetase (AMP-forming)/AMP-acid ligase II
MAADSTLSAMLWSRVAAGPDRPAQLVRRGAGWTALSRREVGDRVRELALGLIARGHKRGDAIAILSASRTEWEGPGDPFFLPAPGACRGEALSVLAGNPSAWHAVREAPGLGEQ